MGRGPWVRPASPAQSRRDFPERFRVKVSEPAPGRLGEVQPHGTTSGLCPQLLPVPALGKPCCVDWEARLDSTLHPRKTTDLT